MNETPHCDCNTKPDCIRPGCTRPQHAKELCRTHYTNARRAERMARDPEYKRHILDLQKKSRQNRIDRKNAEIAALREQVAELSGNTGVGGSSATTSE